MVGSTLKKLVNIFLEEGRAVVVVGMGIRGGTLPEQPNHQIPAGRGKLGLAESTWN